MKYGKLFKGYRNDFNIADDFTANKVSELTYKEIRTMAKNLRTKNNQHIPIAAIIGGEFLKHYQAKIDYSDNTLSIKTD